MCRGLCRRSVCSEYYCTNYNDPPSGAIAASEDGLVTVNGNASFANNIAQENGGKSRLRIRRVNAASAVALDELDAYGLRFILQFGWSNARMNIVNNTDGWYRLLHQVHRIGKPAQFVRDIIHFGFDKHT